MYHFFHVIVFPAVSFVEAFWFFESDEGDFAGAVDACYLCGGVDWAGDEFFGPFLEYLVEICVVDISGTNES